MKATEKKPAPKGTRRTPRNASHHVAREAVQQALLPEAPLTPAPTPHRGMMVVPSEVWLKVLAALSTKAPFNEVREAERLAQEHAQPLEEYLARKPKAASEEKPPAPAKGEATIFDAGERGELSVEVFHSGTESAYFRVLRPDGRWTGGCVLSSEGKPEGIEAAPRLTSGWLKAVARLFLHNIPAALAMANSSFEAASAAWFSREDAPEEPASGEVPAAEAATPKPLTLSLAVFRVREFLEPYVPKRPGEEVRATQEDCSLEPVEEAECEACGTTSQVLLATLRYELVRGKKGKQAVEGNALRVRVCHAHFSVDGVHEAFARRGEQQFHEGTEEEVVAVEEPEEHPANERRTFRVSKVAVEVEHAGTPQAYFWATGKAGRAGPFSLDGEGILRCLSSEGQGVLAVPEINALEKFFRDTGKATPQRWAMGASKPGEAATAWLKARPAASVEAPSAAPPVEEPEPSPRKEPSPNEWTYTEAEAVRGSKRGSFRVVHNLTETVATLTYEAGNDASREQAERNARVMAHAPAMSELLKGLVALASKAGSDSGLGHLGAQASELLERAGVPRG